MKLFVLLMFVNLSHVFAQDEEYTKLNSEYSPQGNIVVPKEDQEIVSEDLKDTQAPEEAYEADEDFLE